jgi:hypothetical protein
MINTVGIGTHCSKTKRAEESKNLVQEEFQCLICNSALFIKPVDTGVLHPNRRVYV